MLNKSRDGGVGLRSRTPDGVVFLLQAKVTINSLNYILNAPDDWDSHSMFVSTLSFEIDQPLTCHQSRCANDFPTSSGIEYKPIPTRLTTMAETDHKEAAGVNGRPLPKGDIGGLLTRRGRFGVS